MKKYRNDYRKKGNRYEYTGQWYRTRLSEQDLRKTVLSSMILGILALGFYIGGMCLNNDGSRVAWVLLPFVFQLLPVAYVIAGSGALYLRIRQNGENTSAWIRSSVQYLLNIYLQQILLHLFCLGSFSLSITGK